MKKIDWTNHILEFVMVVVGILLAFALNNWNENIKDKEKAILYLDGIRSEIEDNYKTVKEAIPYHDTMLVRLRTEPKKAVLIIKGALLKDYAWELAQNDIFKEHIDQKLYKELSDIYYFQSWLKNHNKNAGRLMSEANILGPFYLVSANPELANEGFGNQWKRGWIPIFEEMSAIESLIKKKYDEVLPKLSNQK